MNEVKPDFGTSWNTGASPWVLLAAMVVIGIGSRVACRAPVKHAETRMYNTTYKGDSVLIVVTDSGAEVYESPVREYRTDTSGQIATKDWIDTQRHMIKHGDYEIRWQNVELK